MSTEYDVVILGGGPAGMIAAIRARERGLSVVLIEKNAELGKKLSITGGGRCNITNAEFDIHALLAHYGSAQQFLYSPFSTFGVEDTINFFESRGLGVMVEDRKRAFPKSEKATDVRDLLVTVLKDLHVEVYLNTVVHGFSILNNKVSGVNTSAGTFTGKTYILATGGKSHGETGSTGEGLSWLKELGHTVHTSNPNLVPVIVQDDWVHRLSGTSFSNAKITIQSKTKKIAKIGTILCTHFGFSGPTILNMAFSIKELLKEGPVNATIDLFPKEDVGALRTRFQTLCEENQNKNITNTLKAWFPQSVVDVILEVIPAEEYATKVHSLTREHRLRIVDRMKALTCTITGTKGFDWSIVSDGGVDLEEIHTRTMQSKIHENIYCVGDTLHIQRPSGGYSLQLCWTTGWVAGDSV